MKSRGRKHRLLGPIATFGPIGLALVLVVVFSPVALAGVKVHANKPNEVKFPATAARFVRLTIKDAGGNATCLDELEIYAEQGDDNLAAATRGAKASASSCITGYAIHKIEHLNDGRYGNANSWIAGGKNDEWAQIELPEPAPVARVIFSRDRMGKYRDRLPRVFEIAISPDGDKWNQVARVTVEAPPVPRYRGYVPPVALPDPLIWDGLLRYAFLCERATWRRMNADDHLSPLKTERPALPGGQPYWGRIARLDELERVLVLFEEMATRLESNGLDVTTERTQLDELRKRQATVSSEGNEAAAEKLYLDTRMAKRRLMFRDPALDPVQRILFAKRHPYWASHNYSDLFDSRFRSGGGICTLDIPKVDGRLQPAEAQLRVLFDATDGIARDPITSFDAERVFFAYRPSQPAAGATQCYWNLWAMNVDGSDARQISHGPFHDFFPCPLPDGGLAFISTRCRCRFLCWRPQAFVLFRMELDGSAMGSPGDVPKPLSFANLSEWTPAVMHDGRILWTRSEYQDKGANFGHTLWAIHPDGTHPELIFGNNTNNCYMNAHEVPGTREMVCTLVSHGGDHNGPIGLVDLSKGPFDPTAITTITPDVTPQYDMHWLRYECFRDPIPVSRDYFLVSHAPADMFGLYLVDRYGNRELLYLDPAVGSMRPRLLGAVEPPPVVRPQRLNPDAEVGQLTLTDVYEGLSPAVPRGSVKYLRVCQEVRSELEQLPSGEYRRDHGPDFRDFYATPVHKVRGPNGWPSYVAKASLGLVPVESDGSANFYAPAGKVMYFQALDENFNELQRMRSVMQLQPGEKRSCVGCHEDRQSTPPMRPTIAQRREPNHLDVPSWGDGALAYEAVVQPVLDARCAGCHDANDKQGLNLTGTLDADKVPASYRTLISGGWVHHFNWAWHARHHKADPMAFGTLQSKLWKVLDAGHYDVKLTPDEVRRLKCWIDLNCPLWPDYQYRPERGNPTPPPRVTSSH